MDINIESQIVVQTAAQWAADTDVYSEKRMLVTSDVYYAGTNQRKFKLSNGTDTWDNLDYMPIGSGSGVQSVSGDGVNNTDPSNPVLTFPTPTEIGLGNVDNTSDANKPISSATQTALNAKQNSGSYATGTGTANGTNTGDETAARIGTIVNGATAYTTPLDADKIGVWDVANSLFKALTLANLKATLKTYFDTLYSSGSLYIPNVWISPNFTTKVTGSGWTGTAWFVPFFVAKQTTITELGIEVTTGVAASTIRIGLFSADSSGNVGTLIDQTGTMSSASTGLKSTIISQSIASGLYYLGFQSSAVGVYVRQGNVVSNITEIGGTGAAVLRSTLAYGPFSSNPTVTFTAQTNAPYLLFKTS